MYDIAARRDALRLVAQGHSLNSVSKATGISRSAIRSWGTRVEPLRPRDCPRCARPATRPDPARDYSYVLGLYLGDGCISTSRKGVHVLRIACANDRAGLMDECERAVRAIRPGNRVFRNPHGGGCTMVSSCSKHWPCYFPQHGPGKKHLRRIRLEPWQREIVDEHPWELLRGLIHSDGSRITNWTVRDVGGERKRYEYPRYFFTNKSEDIVRLYCDTLDKVGVEWRLRTKGDQRIFDVSVARREAVALMDSHIGAKF